MAASVAGFNLLDFVHYILAIHNLAEYAIAETLRGGRGEIEEIITGGIDVNKKLCGSGMDIRRPRHGDRIDIVLESIGRFILNRSASLLLVHSWLKPAALNHEAIDHTMKQSVIVVSAFYVVDEVLSG